MVSTDKHSGWKAKSFFGWFCLFVFVFFFAFLQGMQHFTTKCYKKRKEKRITQIFLNTISVSRTDARNDYVTTYKQRFGSCKFTRDQEKVTEML